MIIEVDSNKATLKDSFCVTTGGFLVGLNLSRKAGELCIQSFAQLFSIVNRGCNSVSSKKMMSLLAY